MQSKLKVFEKFVNSVSGWLNWVAIAAFVAMVMLIVVDVLGGKLLHHPVQGSFEVTGFLGLIIIAFALPFTQLLRGHIEVDFFAEKLPKRAQTIIANVISLFCIALFAMMVWQMFDYARNSQISGRVTVVQGIALYPFAYAAASCFFVVCLVISLQFLRAVTRVVRK